MSQLETYPRANGRIFVLPYKENELVEPTEPGQFVGHVASPRDSFGTVVAINVDSVCVLWSKLPKLLSDFANIAFPLVRRVFPPLIAQSLVSIQPMSQPSGLTFYLDYTYGSGSALSGSV